MKRRRPSSVSLVAVWLMAACGTGSNGFDPPPTPPSDDRSESRVIAEVLGAGSCDTVPTPGATLEICSNDPPAGLVSAMVTVDDAPSRCPADRCALELRLPGDGVDEGATLLAAFRPTEGVSDWTTSRGLLVRDPVDGALRGTLIVPSASLPGDLLIALLVYPEGTVAPDPAGDPLVVTMLAELGATQASVLELRVEAPPERS